MLVAVLALLGVFVSLYLTLYKLGYIGTLSCSIGSCETVNTSRWATFAGAPVAAWGLAFYVVTLAVAIVGTLPNFAGSRQPSTALVAMSAAGVAFSAYLTSLEVFVIHAYCIWCLVSAALVTAILVASLLDYREFRAT
jgi:uncharacterized membrane protein